MGEIEKIETKKSNTVIKEPNTTFPQRLLASSSYLIPLSDALQGFAFPLTKVLPHKLSFFVEKIATFQSNLSQLPLYSFSMFSFIYFIFVKKNLLQFSYFIRYNFLQALLLDMFEHLIYTVYFQIFPFSVPDETLVTQIAFFSSIFAAFGICIHGIAHSILAYYPWLPIISDAVTLHIGKQQ